jgi:hypothetical protein
MLFDFECDTCDVISEQFVTSNVHNISCTFCIAGEMHRVISGTSFKLDGTDPAYPTAYDKWAKQHEKAGGLSD